jgi:hypothetical protein
VRALPTLLLAGCALIGAARADEAPPARTPLPSLDACLLHLGADSAQSADKVRTRCPDLQLSLQQSDLALQLPENWPQRLDRSAISDLNWLEWRYQPPPLGSAPSSASLYVIAQALHTQADHVSWWQDFKDWLRDLLLPTTQPSTPWLARWLSKLSVPAWAASSITYLLLGAVVVMAAWIVRREVLAAGLRAASARRAARSGPGAPAGVAGAGLDLAMIDAAPLYQQPSLLLQLLVQTLTRRGRLPDERSLTHRELGVHGVFDDAEQRARFVRLTQLAERLLYGPESAAAGESARSIDVSVSDARRLYTQLRGAVR